jgi:hypothetical protein
MRSFSVCQELLVRANGSTKCGPYLLASSLAAALLDGLFEHPDVFEAFTPSVIFQRFFMCTSSFSAACKAPVRH